MSPGALPSRGLVFQLMCCFHRYWAYSSKSTVRPEMVSCFQDGGSSVSFFTSTRDWICISCIARWTLNHWATREVPLLPFHEGGGSLKTLRTAQRGSIFRFLRHPLVGLSLLVCYHCCCLSRRHCRTQLMKASLFSKSHWTPPTACQFGRDGFGS